MKLTFVRRPQVFTARGETPPPVQFTEVSLDRDDVGCYWDGNNRTLQIKERDGNVLAAFATVDAFYRDSVTVTTSTKDPNAVPPKPKEG